jgi:tRNA (guanine37-N1)-methyltransferase
MTFTAHILTLYPDMFPGPLEHSLSGKALDNEQWRIQLYPLRDYATDKHRSVDDTPAGGGAGMVLRADVLGRALDDVTAKAPQATRFLLSPRGTPLTQPHVRQMVHETDIIFVCGRFEGVDQRVIDTYDLQELSIGDYILSGGEIATLVVLDAIVRLLPGVMGNDQSGEQESFENGLVEHPHYTRPQIWKAQSIPDILLSGHHEKISQWRLAQSEQLTQQRRPDLWHKYSKKP